MTELVYFDDCYRKKMEAEVSEVKQNRVVLDRTIFYPEGGGQPSDRGWIDESEVVKAEKKGKYVEHILDGDLPEEGSTVVCELDWNRRYAHMKYHTAQHILSAIVLEDYDGKTTGNQIHSDYSRIDFDVGLKEEVSDLERMVNSIIEDGIDVDIYVMGREKAIEELDPERTRIDLLPDSITELRIVEIEGIDKTACAGTHVRNTEELGEFTITDTANKGKDRKRVEFVLK
ncbi:MAG: alanyl-tRNA editing protein [Candidatus Hadarchaeia archaeon]